MSIAKALETNKTLRILELSFNRIGPEGATAISKALEMNNTIHTLRLSGNDLELEGVAAIVKVLETNKSLQNLGIDGNKRIPYDLMKQMGRRIEENRNQARRK